MQKYIASIVLVVFASGHDAVATSAEDTETGLVVRDLALLLVDHYGEKLNDRSLYQCTLPASGSSDRARATSAVRNHATPLGVLTFAGNEKDRIDITLEAKGGDVLAVWPSGKVSGNRVHWNNVETLVVGDSPVSLRKDHWLAKLRESDRLYVKIKGKTDKALLYDIEASYTPSLELTNNADRYTLRNTGVTVIHDVTLYSPRGDNSWSVGRVGRLPGMPEPPGETASLLAEEASSDNEAHSNAAEVEAEADGQFKDSDKVSADSSSVTSARSTNTVDITLTELPVIEGVGVLDSWEQLLKDHGYGDAEVRWALSVLERFALDIEQATLVYRLDPDHVEDMFALDVSPDPDNVLRTAIVIHINADPDMQARIGSLIRKLGDENWNVRESAHARLKELVIPARRLLERARENEDMEIVYRAEQLLEELKPSK